MNVRVVIPSKSRVDDCKHALTLFPDALVVVNAEQKELYEKLGCDLLAHPMDVSGIGPLKNWILDNVPDECLLIIDDDVRLLRVSVGRETRSEVIRDPRDIRRVVENAAICARGIGTPVFGFDQSGGDTRKVNPAHPFRLASWVGAQVGIIGRELRFDANLRVRADIDFSLNCLLNKRIVFQDTRFAFVHAPRFTYRGGNALSRSGDRNQKELDYLKKKWGSAIEFRDTATTMRIILQVKRRAGQKG
jgi:hypothetical protein